MRKGKSKSDKSTAKVYEILRQIILERKIAPGSKISQGKLAEELNVSRTPIVKALHKLETQGLVDTSHGKGFYLHRLSILELLDLFILREALEMIIITELTETITPEQIEKLEKVFADFDFPSEEINTIKYWHADRIFHGLLLSFTRNSLVKRIDDNFQIFNRALLGGLLRTPGETLPEHRRIIRALRDRDRNEAIEAVQSHLEKTKLLLQETVKKLQKLGVDPGKIPIEEVVSNSSKK